MTRRPAAMRAGLTAAFTVAVAFAFATEPSRASETLRFRLTNQNESPVSELFFEPLPAGSIVPPIVGEAPDGSPIEGRPLTALPSSTGVDLDSTFVLLGSETGDDGVDRDSLVLLFGFEPNENASPDDPPFLPLLDEQGARFGQLEPGGAFDFELNVGSEEVGSLLVPELEGLTLSMLDLPPVDPNPNPNPDPSDPPSDPSGDPEPTPIPEPAAVWLWGSLALAGVAVRQVGRERRRRRLELEAASAA